MLDPNRKVASKDCEEFSLKTKSARVMPSDFLESKGEILNFGEILSSLFFGAEARRKFLHHVTICTKRAVSDSAFRIVFWS